MKFRVLLGIALIVLGALALTYQGINYTHQKTVIDLGPIHATADDQEHIPIPPFVGGLVLACGVVLLVMGAKQKG